MKSEKIYENTVYEKPSTLRYTRRSVLKWFYKPINYETPMYCSVKMDFYGSLGYDLDNLVKQALDLLVDTDLIYDDVSVYNLEATKHIISTYESERFTIEIYKWVV